MGLINKSKLRGYLDGLNLGEDFYGGALAEKVISRWV
jgi:hypothetical protein